MMLWPCVSLPRGISKGLSTGTNVSEVSSSETIWSTKVLVSVFSLTEIGHWQLDEVNAKHQDGFFPRIQAKTGENGDIGSISDGQHPNWYFRRLCSMILYNDLWLNVLIHSKRSLGHSSFLLSYNRL